MRRALALLLLAVACTVDPARSGSIDAALTVGPDAGLATDVHAGPRLPGSCPGEAVVPADDITLTLVVDISAWPQPRWHVSERLEFTAHAAGSRVRLFGDDHTINWASHPYSYDNQQATFCTGPFTVGQRVAVELAYDTQPPKKKDLTWAAAGLRVWSKFWKTFPLVAIGPDDEPNGSPLWLFSPQARFAVAPLHAGIPAIAHVDLQVVTPGPPWRVVGPSGTGTHEDNIWHFVQDRPVPIYALSFAASPDWQAQELGPSASGIAITALRLPDAKDALGLAPQVIDWMEAHIGPYAFAGDITLPVLPEYDLAMEDVGNVWFSQKLSGDPNTVAHELVHQWFGNGVRIAGWEHTWLDEGLTTWVTDFQVIPALFDPPLWPDLTWAAWDRQNAGELCRMVTEGPLHLPAPVDANLLWPKRNYHYVYAAAVFHMIDLRLTERYGTTLLAVLHDWFAAQHGNAVTTRAFRDFLGQRTGDAAYWQAFFADWVESTPCPTLTVFPYLQAGKPHIQIRRKPTAGQALLGLPVTFHVQDADVTVLVDLPSGVTSAELGYDLPYFPTTLRIDTDWRYAFYLKDESLQVPGTIIPMHVTYLPK